MPVCPHGVKMRRRAKFATTCDACQAAYQSYYYETVTAPRRQKYLRRREQQRESYARNKAKD